MSALVAGPVNAQAASRRRNARHRLDELEWLIDGGTWIGTAVTRCGWARASSAAGMAYRHDRPDLGRRLAAFAAAEDRA